MDPHLVFSETTEDRKNMEKLLYRTSKLEEAMVRMREQMLHQNSLAFQTSLLDDFSSVSLKGDNKIRKLNNISDEYKNTFVTKVEGINPSDYPSSVGLLSMARKIWHLFDRYLWLILQVIAFLISYKYIKEAYESWQDSPVVVSVNNTQTYVWDIPFPAVTLCSQPTINDEYNLKKQVFKCFECEEEYFSNNCNVSSKCAFSELASMSIAYMMCVDTIYNSVPVFDHHWEFLLEPLLGNISLEGQFTSYMKEVLPECKLYYQKEPTFGFGDCAGLQTLLMGFLDSPVCSTFNSLKIPDLYEDNVVPAAVDDRRDELKSKVSSTTDLWSTDTMRSFADRKDTIPLYGLEWLKITYKMINNRNFMSCSNGIEVNPRIALHHPGEVPMVENTKFYSFSVNKSILIEVTPKMTTAHKNIADYHSAKRVCYYANEHKLSLFRFYTQKNCQIECRVNCTLAMCGCVPYYLPRQNGSVKLCNKDGILCSQYRVLPDKMIAMPWTEELTFPACICDCLPDCNSLSYDFGVEEKPDLLQKNSSLITIKYKGTTFSSTVRYSVSNWAELVAYSLGILGVFNGLCGVGVCQAVYHKILQFLRYIQKLWTHSSDK